MIIDFLVTTQSESVAQKQNDGYQIIMVDGTVPDWSPREGDLHFDHHRPGGKKVQIDEIPPNIIGGAKVCFVTTMVDADACAAAAYILITKPSEDSFFRLRAIAYDCDHLFVPENLKGYADFASQAVAAMKQDSNSLVDELGLPANRREWSLHTKERFASLAFKRSTYHLVDAALGLRQWPGENGEAKPYWDKVVAYTNQLQEEERVTEYCGVVLIDMKELGGQYIDPRCPLRVVKGWKQQPSTPVSITKREVYVENEFKGYSYTIGSIPWHEDYGLYDYTQGLWQALTNAEVAKGGDPHINKWGGRATVGGSGWNAVSFLTPEEVADVALKVLNL